MAIFGCACTATIMISIPFIFGFVVHKAMDDYETIFATLFGICSVIEWFFLLWILMKVNGLC